MQAKGPVKVCAGEADAYRGDGARGRIVRPEADDFDFTTEFLAGYENIGPVTQPFADYCCRIREPWQDKE
jgi:hypothetical protein